MLDFYILQDQSYGLGNFINLTPAIKSIAELKGEAVPVYFDIEHVEQCFIDCPFITILKEQPVDRPLFTSGAVDHDNRIPDYIHSYILAAKLFDIAQEIPHTYVDQAKEIAKHENYYALFMYGSGNEDTMYLHKKTPKKHYYADQMSMGARTDIFTGSSTDFTRVHWFNHMDHYLDDIRKSLALIRDADYIVSNDTGLAHAAGAMNKDLLILWKTTKLPKNGNPGHNTKLKLCL